MLFLVGSSIIQAYECTQGFYFIIDGIIIIPEYDDESCFITVDNSRLNVKHI